jgi:ATP-dependent DNA ligase
MTRSRDAGPSAGPGWLHEIKFDGYRAIAPEGERVRLWARTTSVHSGALTRIRDVIPALPADSALRRIGLCRGF